MRIAKAAALREASGRPQRQKSRVEFWREAIEASLPVDKPVHTLVARASPSRCPNAPPGRSPSGWRGS